MIVNMIILMTMVVNMIILISMIMVVNDNDYFDIINDYQLITN